MSISLRRLVYFLPLVFFLSLGLLLWGGIGEDPSELPSVLVGKPLPDFALLRFSSDAILTAQDMPHEAYLLNVWASWCVSCRMEHPFLQQLAAEGIPVIGLNYKDDASEARQMLNDLGNPYRFSISDPEGTLGLDLGVSGAPETFLIDAQGIIRYRRIGVLNPDIWREQLLPFFQNPNHDP